MTIADVISRLSPDVIVALVALFVLFVLLVPISLRIAGLTGQQIGDVLTLTLQFFINLVKEFRAQNKQS